MIKTIAFDADDTLWQNETRFVESKKIYCEILSSYKSTDYIDKRLYEVEIRNLRHFGYGVKGFVLSMIETAIELTDSKVTGADIEKILNIGKEMLAAPVELLDGVGETIKELSESYNLMIITKGDLFDQESKIARSQIGDYFGHCEIVSEKDVATYKKIMNRYNILPREFLMVGNSIKSDIIPVISAGGHAIHIPHAVTWNHEVVPDSETHTFLKLSNMRFLGETLKVAKQFK